MVVFSLELAVQPTGQITHRLRHDFLGILSRCRLTAGDMPVNVGTSIDRDKPGQNICSDMGHALDHHLLGFNTAFETAFNRDNLGAYMPVNLTVPV